MNSASVFTGSALLITSTLGVPPIMPIGVKSLIASYGALHQRVAVGRGARRGDAGDDAAAAALVLDDEVLAERLAPALADDARDHVVAAAGRDRDDVADRLARERLRARLPGQAEQGRC